MQEDKNKSGAAYEGLDELWFKLRSAELRRGAQEQRLVGAHMLLLAKSGGGRLTVDLMEYALKPDTAYYIRPRQTIGLVSELEDAPPEWYAFQFDVSMDRETVASFPYEGEVSFYGEKQTGALCELVCSSLRSGSGLERFRGQSAFQELLYRIATNRMNKAQADSKTAIDRTKVYMDAHYAESLTIEQLAGMAEISPKYYVHLFKKTYGISAIDYLTEVRVNAAKRLMAPGGVRFRDIARQVGYSDEFYFSRKFKQEVGVSPTVYMKNRRRKIAAYSTSVLGQLLALKIIPYGAPLHPKWTAYYYKTYRSDIPLHLSAYRINQDWKANIRTLAASAPDVIVCSDTLSPDEKELLAGIAPILCVPDRSVGWRGQLRILAQALGEPQEAEQWLSRYERKVAAARGRLREQLGGETVLIMSLCKQTCIWCPTRGMRDVLYRDLGLVPPPGFDPERNNVPIPMERLVECDADRILLNICQEPESLDCWERLKQSAEWLELKAVRSGMVELVGSDPWREYSSYACERMVDDAVARLAGGNRPNEFRI